MWQTTVETEAVSDLFSRFRVTAKCEIKATLLLIVHRDLRPSRPILEVRALKVRVKVRWKVTSRATTVSSSRSERSVSSSSNSNSKMASARNNKSNNREVT